MNKNYQRGVRFERQVMQKLAADGYTTLRTAGSHGAVDVMAIKETGIKMIQCKTTDKAFSLSAYMPDIMKLSAVAAPVTCSKELWVKNDSITTVLII